MASIKQLLKRVVQPSKAGRSTRHGSQRRATQRKHDQTRARLPNELIFNIFELATAHDVAATEPAASTTEPSRQAVLTTIARVSKLCCAWAQEQLYDNPIISTPAQARKFKKTVDRALTRARQLGTEHGRPSTLTAARRNDRRRNVLKLVRQITLEGQGAVFHIANLNTTFDRSTRDEILGGRVPSIKIRNTTIPTFFAFAAIAETLQHLTLENVLLADRTLTVRYHPFFVRFTALNQLDLHSTKIEAETATIFLSHSMLPTLTRLTMDHVKLLKDFEEAADPLLQARRPVAEDASAMGVDEDVEVFDPFLLGQLEKLSLAGREGRLEEDEDEAEPQNGVIALPDMINIVPRNEMAPIGQGAEEDDDDDSDDAATVMIPGTPRQRQLAPSKVLWTVERRMLAQCHVLQHLCLDETLSIDADELRLAVPSPLLAA
ncbi:hypothetical protein OIO90_004544 [Microbotryomycetes sp. JL221]|nr:hypothetical protein OIO90_004544 [Microbotryomycetes sp. JL221]